MDIKSKTNRATLKGYFVKNAIPTQRNFEDLIDSLVNQADDGIVKLPGEPLSLQPDNSDTGPNTVINFYKKLTEDKPTWTLSLSPHVNKADPKTVKSGWSLGNKDGASRLFIDENTGHVGIGTIDPDGYQLNVNGDLKATTFVGERGNLEALEVKGGNAIINNAFVGDVGYGAGWAGFAHKDSVSKLGYGLLQKNNGSETRVNIKGGSGHIGFSVDNSDKMVLLSNGNVGIGTNTPSAKLEVKGNVKATKFIGDGSGLTSINASKVTGTFGGIEVNGAAVISNGKSWATKREYMSAGSLTLGGIDKDYGGGKKWNENTAGLLLETLNNTEIAVHDAGMRVASLMHYQGDSANSITIGRDMGWGAIKEVVLNGNVGIGTTTPVSKLHIHGDFKNKGTGGFALDASNTDDPERYILRINPFDMKEGSGKVGYQFETKSVKGGVNVPLTFDNAGNVGIGTKSPSAKLEVNGDIKVTGKNSTIVQPDWTTPKLQNNWENFGNGFNPAGFFKDSLGIVHLRGMVTIVTGGPPIATVNAIIFTLPPGYLPSFQELFVVCTFPDISGRLDVQKNGDVWPVAGSSGWLSLDGITFRAKK